MRQHVNPLSKNFDVVERIPPLAEMFDDTTGNGFYDFGEPFEDKGNGIYDNTEEFILRDLNGDGNQEKLLYTLHNKPSKLLFDWSDRLNPVALLEVSQDDSLVGVRGNVYKNIIEEVDFTPSKLIQENSKKSREKP